MQPPQYATYGYADPGTHFGAGPSYGNASAEVGNQSYGASYGAAADSYAYAPNPHPPPHQTNHPREQAPSYYPTEGAYAQAPYSAGTPSNSYAGGVPSNPAPSNPQMESHAGASFTSVNSHVGLPAPPANTNPNQGSDTRPQSEIHGAYGGASLSSYGYTQPYGGGLTSGYGSTEGSHGTQASSAPDTYVNQTPSYGVGPPTYGGQQANPGAPYGDFTQAPPPPYKQSEAGYGASYGAGQAVYSGYDTVYGSAQQVPPYGQHPPPSTSLHTRSDSTPQQLSYLITPPQSSNPSYDSIHAGLSSLNLGNPTKQPNYLERADSGGNNLISFKSSYGGTIRYEAPRTSSQSNSRSDSSAYGRSSASSELIDIVQGPGSSERGSYRSGRAQPPDTIEGEGGVQRYKVRLMAEDGSGGSSQPVQCQIALDGVRLFNADGKTTLRIYPLKSITRWAVQQPSVFTFWAKTSVDVEQRAVKLSSNEGTTTAILDTLTAACVQLGEMMEQDGGGSQAPTSAAITAASSDSAKPKGVSIVEWVTKKPPVEEKQHWIPDESVTKCSCCGSTFTAFNRRHHCRNCGEVFCDSCTKGRIALTGDEGAPQVRVCDRCLAEVTHRLQNVQPTKVAAAPATPSHEDLARKLQAELDRQKPASAAASSGGGGGTTVLTCQSCGSVSLGSGSNTRCSACGADVNKPRPSSSSRQSGGSSRQSYKTEGPPHLWDQQPAKTGERTRQVACPTCTVHLTVKVPSQGTETVECGVCQHPFLVEA